MHIKRLSLALFLMLGIGRALAADPEPTTLVVVNGQPVSFYDFSAFVTEFDQNPEQIQNDPEVRSKVLAELITTILIAQAAEADGLYEQPRVKAQLAINRARILAQSALQQFWRDNPVSDEALKKEYEELSAKEQEMEYKARHILLETEDDAETVIEELEGGADFVELAKEKSTGPSGPTGGDLGWFGGGQMVKPFSEAVAKLEDGKYTSSPVKTQFGWHVILREESRSKRPPSFEDVKGQLAAKLRRKSAEEYVTALREKSQIEVKAPPEAPAQDETATTK